MYRIVSKVFILILPLLASQAYAICGDVNNLIRHSYNEFIEISIGMTAGEYHRGFEYYDTTSFLPNADTCRIVSHRVWRRYECTWTQHSSAEAFNSLLSSLQQCFPNVSISSKGNSWRKTKTWDFNEKSEMRISRDERVEKMKFVVSIEIPRG